MQQKETTGSSFTRLSKRHKNGNKYGGKLWYHLRQKCVSFLGDVARHQIPESGHFGVQLAVREEHRVAFPQLVDQLIHDLWNALLFIPDARQEVAQYRVVDATGKMQNKFML